LNSQARQRSSSLLSLRPNITARSNGREFFPVRTRAPLLGPSSFSSSLPHSTVRHHRSVVRQADCVSCVAHPRSSSTCRSSSHCVRQYRHFSCSVLARFPARQRALSACSALIPISSSTSPRLSSSVVLLGSCPSSSLRRSQSSGRTCHPMLDPHLTSSLKTSIEVRRRSARLQEIPRIG
jgi:hypothetical protein